MSPVHAFCAPRDLPAFPTRRSSDLTGRVERRPDGQGTQVGPRRQQRVWPESAGLLHVHAERLRPEEHTSERHIAVKRACRVLLEKKNKNRADAQGYHELLDQQASTN